MVDENYRPIAAPDRRSVRPRFPLRLRAFMYACALHAADLDGLMKKQQGRPPNRAQRRAR